MKCIITCAGKGNFNYERDGGGKRYVVNLLDRRTNLSDIRVVLRRSSKRVSNTKNIRRIGWSIISYKGQKGGKITIVYLEGESASHSHLLYP